MHLLQGGLAKSLQGILQYGSPLKACHCCTCCGGAHVIPVVPHKHQQPVPHRHRRIGRPGAPAGRIPAEGLLYLLRCKFTMRIEG